MQKNRINNLATDGLKEIVKNYLPTSSSLPQYLVLPKILTNNFLDDPKWSGKQSVTRCINTIGLLRWLCEDIGKVIKASSDETNNYMFALLMFRLFEVTIFDEIIQSQAFTQLYRATSKPYAMSFQPVDPNNQKTSQQIDQKLSINQKYSSLYQQRQKSNKKAIESLQTIPAACFQFVSIDCKLIAQDVFSYCKNIKNERINFSKLGKGLKIIVANLGLNLRRELRKEKNTKIVQCEECRSKIEFRLYLLSALILPHSLELIKQQKFESSKERSPLKYFNQPNGISKLYQYLFEVGSIELNDSKRYLSSLISRKDQ